MENVSLGESGAMVITGGQVTGERIRSGVIISQEVQAERVQAGLFFARHVEGSVETMLDQRGALTLGVALGLALGLLSLVRTLLVRRNQ